MGKRREGREAAVQFLFQDDLNKTDREALAEVLEEFWKLRESALKTRQFASELIRGVLENHDAIDERIKRVTANYELHRIAPVVDKVYPFTEARAALEAMKAGDHFGKIVLTF